MAKENNTLTHNGHTYWITIQPGILKNKTVYCAFVSKDKEPSALHYGELLRHPEGQVMLFEDGLHALMVAKDVILHS